jgi:hypothetical protein
MTSRFSLAVLALAVVPSLVVAQAPVADALRANTKQYGKNLSAAAEVMPADKYAFKPTPAQMSFGDVVTHLIEGNDYLCGLLGGTQAPTRTKVTAADKKEALVARLKETFAFCDQALATLDDSKLGEQVSLFGMKMSRAGAEMLTVGDWADHYSQMANYLRLNGQLPPTAKK